MTTPIRKIALTGGIASGKSLVGDYLTRRGVPVIDADTVVHELLRTDADIHAKIRHEFGQDVFTPSGEVNRQKLGAKVFGAPQKRKLLESWIHPRVRELIEQFFKANLNRPLGVAMIPLLFESNLESRYDEVWLMETDEAAQIQRLMDRRGLSRDEAMARIRSQMPMDEKRKRLQAHPDGHIITNNARPEDVCPQVDRLLQRHGV